MNSKPATLIRSGLAMFVMGCASGIAQVSTEPPQGPLNGPGPEFTQSVLLSNGDTLTGRLVSMGPEQGLEWKHRDADRPIRFSADEVVEVRSHGPRHTEEIAEDVWKIYLANGDILEGRLTELTTETVAMEDALMGPVRFPRRFVRVLNPVFRTQAPVYLGFNGPGDWIVGQVDTEGLESGPWTYKNHAYYAFKAASMAKNVGLPEQVSIKFTLAWKGPLSVAIGLYTDSLEPISLDAKEDEPEFGGFYSLAIYDTGAVLRGINQNDPIKQLGQLYLQNLGQKNFAEFEVLVHQEGKAIILKIDGETVHLWREPDEFMGEGSGLRFVHQGRGALRISDLEIRHWDGQLQSPANIETSAIQDALWLAGGKKLLGDVLALTEDGIVFQPNASAETETVPVDEIQQVVLRRTEAPELLSGAPASQISGTNGEKLTFSIDRISDGLIIGNYPGAGEISVPVSSLTHIRFR